MEYIPPTHKFVAVLNKKVEQGRLMNALSHMAAGISAHYSHKEELRFNTYRDKDGGKHNSISDNAFIVLSADNSNQLRTLRNNLLAENIFFVDFTSTMVEGTYADQHERTLQTPEIELEYWGVCLFGEIEKVSRLTKKFSLWR